MKIKLSEVNRDNNLNIIRFVAAVLVIISHSVPLCYGSQYSDFLSIWTDSRLSLGGMAVGVFFVTGGFLIAKSAESKKTAKQFFEARCLRIFPQLIFVTVLATFLLGSILSVLPIQTYLTSVETYKYLLNCILIPIHDLPGVFTNNIFGQTVNGPLWTLPIEFFCYCIAFFAYKITKFNKKIVFFTIPIAMICCGGAFYFFYDNVFMISVIRPIVLYYIGILLYTYRESIVLSSQMLLISIVLFFGLVAIKFDLVAMVLVFPVLIYNLAYATKRKMNRFGTKYELSYGLYLWGWICQQIIIHFFGTMPWYKNAILAIPLALILSLINNIIVDKKITPWLFQKLDRRV